MSAGRSSGGTGMGASMTAQGNSSDVAARRKQRERATAEKELLHLEAPYGKALRHIDVENRDGTHLRVQYCCPRAFLWLCCLVSVAFKTFLADHLPDGRSRVCLYCDDVRPGNIHRPESARLYYSFYYR
mgnify:CR=1 FL=1